ncbi:MAG: hypothetical protein FJ403_04995 [Verrucomicrobia bacterium]|nr:hypothetical protein [Verrucomicrobiota bacterium]
MGEEVQRYKTIRISEAKPAGPQTVKVSWEGSAKQNYKTLASTHLTMWQTVVDDVGGADGIVSRNLDFSLAGTQPLFLRVGSIP